MFYFSIAKVLTSVFLIYIIHSLYSVYTLFRPPLCQDPSSCINYYLKKSPKLQLVVFTSVRSSPVASNEVNYVGKISNMDYTIPFEKTLNLTLPLETQRNGSFFLHLFLLPQNYQAKYWNDASSSADSVYTRVPLTDYHVPSTSTYQLLMGEKGEVSRQKFSHLKSEVTVRILTGVDSFPRDNIPVELFRHFKVSKSGNILPVMLYDILSDRLSHYKNTTDRPFGEILLKYSPINLGNLRLMLLADSQFYALKSYGFSQKDLDEMKGVFADTNVYLLCVTIFVASVHVKDLVFAGWEVCRCEMTINRILRLLMIENEFGHGRGMLNIGSTIPLKFNWNYNIHNTTIAIFIKWKVFVFNETCVQFEETLATLSIGIILDILAFKNDVIFWKNRNSMVGLSLRAVLWRAFSQVIIFLFLLDEGTSLLVLGPAAIGTLIEFWKIQKVLPIDWRRLKFKKITLTEEEKSTMDFDAEGMRYLSYILYPLCVLAAIYSLLYLEFKSWYSWVIHSLVNCVYVFGFIFMLPQLFINYKLKSVANLPWRAFMYKAFNTFIDDLFAFIISMPTAHRLACFRDDIVFVIYLYQRWLYPVDSGRIDDDTMVSEEHLKKN